MRMITILIASAGFMTTACQISPVVNDPAFDDPHGSLYDDCRRASRDYCRDALKVEADDVKRCQAESTYTCVTGKR